MLKARAERTLTLNLRSPHRLIPVHIGGRPPPYFILGGLVFTQVPLRLRMLCHASACACHGLVGFTLSLSWACQCLSWWGSIDLPASTVPAQPVQILRCCAVTSGGVSRRIFLLLSTLQSRSPQRGPLRSACYTWALHSPHEPVQDAHIRHLSFHTVTRSDVWAGR